MQKMSEKAMKKANGGLKCPYCGWFFPFLPGWNKRYNNHMKKWH